MAGRQYQQVAYGLSSPLIAENPTPVIAKRNPTTSDFAFPTTIWTNTTTNAIYILASISNNQANWVLLEVGGGAGVFASLTVTPGPISLTGTTTINTAGAAATNIGTTPGTGAVNIGNTTGNTLVTGTLTATGNITSSTGNIASTLGSVAANTTVTAGTGITATGGNITATLGGVFAGGTVNAGTNVVAATTVTAGTGITATAGNIAASNGNITLGTAATSFIFANGIAIMAGTANPNTSVTAPKGSLFLTSNGSGVGDRAWINTGGGTAWTAITTAS